VIISQTHRFHARIARFVRAEAQAFTPVALCDEAEAYHADGAADRPEDGVPGRRHIRHNRR